MITHDFSEADERNGASTILDLEPFLARARKAVPVSGEVSVLLTSDRKIRKLNKEFRGIDKATDVLSFSALAARPRSRNNRSSAEPAIAGDLAISIDTAQRQATQFGHTLQIELKILLLHGLLHLAGYDHEADSGEMAAREEELRRRFRLPGALIARADLQETHVPAISRGARR